MKDALLSNFFQLALAAPVGSPRSERLLPALGSLSPISLPRRAGSPTGKSRVYLYRWDRCGRKGQRCRVFARGTMNSVGLLFEDGFTMVTSGNALRRA
ncbi:MAG TPA: hypothetical protein VGN82_14445 [Bosea sp. (in: a-proteobacteria)]|jgi:hypothetical protein|uniref:hypothetical protein n=1 Tax=Bosea sp. (in: a-proteobacteria) TaxID=1871050 RepID=UPI002E0F84EC|nr:hypothetical protein [Bosea sp. (in: a-proteobacteria)]